MYQLSLNYFSTNYNWLIVYLRFWLSLRNARGAARTGDAAFSFPRIDKPLFLLDNEKKQARTEIGESTIWKIVDENRRKFDVWFQMYLWRREISVLGLESVSSATHQHQHKVFF